MEYSTHIQSQQGNQDIMTVLESLNVPQLSCSFGITASSKKQVCRENIISGGQYLRESMTERENEVIPSHKRFKLYAFKFRQKKTRLKTEATFKR